MSDLHRVRVTCKRGNGLWRGGKHWPNGHTEVELDRPAIEVLLKERLLTVAVHDGKSWRVASKEAAPAASPAAGEPPLESEVKELEDTISRLRAQLREERDAHSAERAELLDSIASLQAQLEAATAPALTPEPTADAQAYADAQAGKAKKK